MSRVFLLVTGIVCTSLIQPESDADVYMEVIAGSDESIHMTYIEGGSFMMGSPSGEPGRQPDEGPQREVTIGDFWMATYEISWDQYQQFLYRKDRIDPDERGEIQLNLDGFTGATMPYVNYNRPGYPVIDITQHAASTFCKWLTAKTGRFYRLPTEAEWEYACRAGSSGTFPDNIQVTDLENFAWYKGNSNGMLQKGGLKKPLSNGLHDMLGNAAEWVIDGYSQEGYDGLEMDNPVNFTDDLYPRVVRGGSFKDEWIHVRSASRSHSRPQWKQRDPQFPKSLWWHTDALHVGFRIVRPKVVPSASEMEKYWGEPIEEY